MSEFKITGSPGDDPVGWIRHLLEESKRLGEHVRDEGKETQRKFDELRTDFHSLQIALRGDISVLNNDLNAKLARLEQKQAVMNTEMKLKIAGISGVVSTLTTIVLLLLKSGVLG